MVKEKILTRRKFIEDTDYPLLEKWWISHGGEHGPNKNFLSTTGIVVELDKEPIAIIFMYHANSATCIADFFTVNPKAAKKDRDKAINYLIEISHEWAKKCGYKFVYTSVNVKKYIKRLVEHGFKEISKNASHCFLEVDKNE